MKLINEINESQEELMQTYLNMGFKYGLGTKSEQPSNEVIDGYVENLYSAIGLKKPLIFHVASPLQGSVVTSILLKLIGKNSQLKEELDIQLKDQLGNQLWDQLEAQLSDQLEAQLRNQLGNQLWDQLRNQLEAQLSDQLMDQLEAQLRNQLGHQLKDQLGNQLWNQLWDKLGNQLGNQLEAQLGNQLRNQLRNQLWAQLGGQLRNQLWAQLGGQLRNQLRNQLWAQLGGQLWGELSDQLWGELSDQLEVQLRNQLWNQLKNQLWAQLGGQLEVQLRNQLGNQLKNQLGNQLWAQLGGQLRYQLWNQLKIASRSKRGEMYNTYYMLGQTELYWLTFYKYINDVLPVFKTKEPLNELFDLCKSVNFFWPYKGFIVLSDKPEFIKMKNKRLHCIDGPSIKFSDGFSFYSMNGVSFSGDMIDFVITPADKLDSKKVLNITNVEQRAEVIKKIGVEKLFWDLKPKKLDTKDDYELYSVPVYEDIPRIYLKMKNPSVDEIHIEAVNPSCKTVEQALAWRNFGEVNIPYIKPQQLT